MGTVLTAWVATSRPVVYGPTATTCTLHTQRSVVTRNPVSAVKPTKWLWNTTSRPRTCWSATAPAHWVSSKQHAFVAKTGALGLRLLHDLPPADYQRRPHSPRAFFILNQHNRAATAASVFPLTATMRLLN